MSLPSYEIPQANKISFSKLFIEGKFLFVHREAIRLQDIDYMQSKSFDGYDEVYLFLKDKEMVITFPTELEESQYVMRSLAYFITNDSLNR